jgi:hypothetical protein
MTVTTMDRSQVKALSHHLEKAKGLEAKRLGDLRTLASQLADCEVLPILGAGASFDCGMRLAKEIGKDLYDAYTEDPTFNHVEGLEPDLAEVAQAIWAERSDQKEVVRAVELHHPSKWPDADGMGDHFCAYRVLARLIREGFAKEGIGFNYDCGAEAGFDGEGFLLNPRTEPGRKWQDHVSVIPDEVTNAQVTPRGDFTLFKAHGCAARYREVATTEEERAAESIVIRTGQLTNWRKDLWMRDVLRSRAGNHVLLLVGFSGQDPVIQQEMESVLRNVYKAVQPNGQPRIVVVDYKPDTATLRSLVKVGLGEQPAALGTVSSVGTKEATTTSALLVLMVESIAHRLEGEGQTVPKGIDARLASLAISAPIMLRWSYILHPGSPSGLMQRSNLQQFGDSGYVPLTAFPDTTAKVIGSREALRARLKRTGPESIEEALENDGFVVNGGAAYLPVGLDMDRLKEACASGEVLEEVRLKLSHPDLECVLVPTDSADAGVSLGTGCEVGIA